MLSKRLHVIALLLLVIGLGGLQAQSVYVNKNNGTPEGYALKRIQSMHFESGKLKVNRTDATTDQYALRDVRNLVFIEETLGMDEFKTVSENLISLYPNPVRQTLHLDLSNVEEGNISIFNMQGQLLHTQEVSHQPTLTVEVGHLPKGVYFCRYNHVEKTETIKFIKE